MIGGHDPMAMPAPPEVMLFLLGLTFVAHISLLGLLFSSLWARAGAEWGVNRVYDALRVHRAGVVGFSMTITTGVPPLLFVQILYEKYFYSSSISIGFPWLAIVGYLLLGFYAMYWTQWSWMRNGGPSLSGKLFWIVTVLCIIAIGFTYSWNHLKSMSETPWDNRASHLHALHRLLGYFGAALIASGAWGSWFGVNWRTDKRVPKGAGWAALVGGAGLMTWAFTSYFARTGAFGLDRPFILLGSGIAVFAGVLAVMTDRVSVARWLVTIAAPVGTLGLLLQREAFRLETMRAYYDPFALVTRTQWSTVVMFVAALLAGLGVLIWLLLLIRRVPKQAQSAS
jgi:hypothetical protein